MRTRADHFVLCVCALVHVDFDAHARVSGVPAGAGAVQQGAVREELLQPAHRVRLGPRAPRPPGNLRVPPGTYLHCTSRSVPPLYLQVSTSSVPPGQYLLCTSRCVPPLYLQVRTSTEPPPGLYLLQVRTYTAPLSLYLKVSTSTVPPGVYPHCTSRCVPPLYLQVCTSTVPPGPYLLCTTYRSLSL